MVVIDYCSRFFGKNTLKACVLLSLIAFVSSFISVPAFQALFYICLIVIASLAIWKSGDHFSHAAVYIEEQHNIPQSVKAAVIDAIASSFPEFAVVMVAVFTLGKFEVGLATIAGSALYNVLIIPAASGLVAATPMVISREVVWRDNLFYILVILATFVFVLVFDEWGLGISLTFLAIYAVYIYTLTHHYRSYKQNQNDPTEPEEAQDDDDEQPEFELKSEKVAWIWIVAMMLMMGASSHVLVEASIGFGAIINVDPVIMAFVVIAAGTSVPDTALSVLSAKKGHYDAAISNIFGSNIFDLCICLGLPILLVYLMTGESTVINMIHIELLVFVVIATIISFYFFYSHNYTVGKIESALMLLLYMLIFMYALFLIDTPVDHFIHNVLDTIFFRN